MLNGLFGASEARSRSAITYIYVIATNINNTYMCIATNQKLPVGKILYFWGSPSKPLWRKNPPHTAEEMRNNCCAYGEIQRPGIMKKIQISKSIRERII